MKPTKEQINAYKKMAQSSPDSMRNKIRVVLEKTCAKFYGNESNHSNCKPTKKASEAMQAWMQKFIKVDTRKLAKKKAA